MLVGVKVKNRQSMLYVNLSSDTWLRYGREIQVFHPPVTLSAPLNYYVHVLCLFNVSSSQLPICHSTVRGSENRAQ